MAVLGLPWRMLVPREAVKLQTGPAASAALEWVGSDLTRSVVGLQGTEERREQQETVRKQR